MFDSQLAVQNHLGNVAKQHPEQSELIEAYPSRRNEKYSKRILFSDIRSWKITGQNVIRNYLSL